MKKLFATKLIAAHALFYWSAACFAHENHGLTGSHWHATDTLGLLLVGALAGLALWWSGRQ